MRICALDTASPGHRALRKGRVSIRGQVYLVTTVTHDRRPPFRDWTLGRVVIAEMRRLHDGGGVQSLAFVLMPDHLHWLLGLREPLTLSAVVKRFKGRSARAVNAVLACTGPVWQPAFHDHAVRREEDPQDLARYIVANPLRAGLVQQIVDYPLWDASWL
jgi:REP-associated tyrosine transposase